jgi:hypothetical protein
MFFAGWLNGRFSTKYDYPENGILSDQAAIYPYPHHIWISHGICPRVAVFGHVYT